MPMAMVRAVHARGRAVAGGVGTVDGVTDPVAAQTVRELVAAAAELDAAPVRVGGVLPAPPGEFVRVRRQGDRAPGVPVPDHRGLYESAVRADHPRAALARQATSRRYVPASVCSSCAQFTRCWRRFYEYGSGRRVAGIGSNRTRNERAGGAHAEGHFRVRAGSGSRGGDPA